MGPAGSEEDVIGDRRIETAIADYFDTTMTNEVERPSFTTSGRGTTRGRRAPFPSRWPDR